MPESEPPPRTPVNVIGLPITGRDLLMREPIPWAETKAQPTPPDLARTEWEYIRDRLLREVWNMLTVTAGVHTAEPMNPQQVRALTHKIVNRVLFELVKADPEAFTAAWHQLLARYDADQPWPDEAARDRADVDPVRMSWDLSPWGQVPWHPPVGGHSG